MGRGLGSYAILGPKLGDHKESVKKVLFIRFSSIGDIVLTTPLIRVLKEQYPEPIELHYLLKAPFRNILQEHPGVDQVHAWDQDGNKDLLARLRKEHFDHVLDLQGSLRSLRIRSLLKRPYSSFSKLNKEKWILVNFGIDRLPERHVVDRYFQALSPFGLKNDQKGLDLYVATEEEITPQKAGLSSQEPFISFAIGGAHATKRLPEERIVELCRRIDMPVILLGGKEDRERGARIADASGASVFDRTGQFSIGGSASIIRQSAAVLTHDTGMMHIAAAFKRPVLSFWGNTVPAFGMTPYMPGYEDRSKIFEVKGLSCRPCSKLGHDACPKGHFRCMWGIDPEQVLTTLDGMVEKSA